MALIRSWAIRSMNLFPEVKWDRFAGDEMTQIGIFGWIPRDDGKSDFCYLIIDHDGPWLITTSSEKYSEEFSRRIHSGKESITHRPCRRVEDHFEGVKCVKLTDPKESLLPLDQKYPTDPEGQVDFVLSVFNHIKSDMEMARKVPTSRYLCADGKWRPCNFLAITSHGISVEIDGHEHVIDPEKFKR